MLLAEREREKAFSRVEVKVLSAAESQGNGSEATRRTMDKKRQSVEMHDARPGIEVRALTATKGPVSTENTSKTRDSKEAIYVSASSLPPSKCQLSGPLHPRSPPIASMSE